MGFSSKQAKAALEAASGVAGLIGASPGGTPSGTPSGTSNGAGPGAERGAPKAKRGLPPRRPQSTGAAVRIGKGGGKVKGAGGAGGSGLNPYESLAYGMSSLRTLKRQRNKQGHQAKGGQGRIDDATKENNSDPQLHPNASNVSGPSADALATTGLLQQKAAAKAKVSRPATANAVSMVEGGVQAKKGRKGKGGMLVAKAGYPEHATLMRVVLTSLNTMNDRTESATLTNRLKNLFQFCTPYGAPNPSAAARIIVRSDGDDENGGGGGGGGGSSFRGKGPGGSGPSSTTDDRYTLVLTLPDRSTFEIEYQKANFFGEQSRPTHHPPSKSSRGRTGAPPILHPTLYSHHQRTHLPSQRTRSRPRCRICR